MSDIRYKITMDGSLAPGVTLDFAQANVARLFKTDESAVKRLFSGSSIAIKSDIGSVEADKYITALFNAGVIAQKEADVVANLSLESIETDSSAENLERMTCPKCATEQAQHEMCQNCGIVIAKFNSYQAQVQPEISSATLSPYASPAANIEEDTDEVGELKIWGVEGRIGRMRYIAWSMVLMFAMMPAIIIGTLAMSSSIGFGSILMAVVGIAGFVVGIQMGVKRLHDLGWSGWLLLIALIPIVGGIFQLLTFVMPGSTGSNRYGAIPPENSTAVKVLFWIWVACVAIGVIGGIASGILVGMLAS